MTLFQLLRNRLRLLGLLCAATLVSATAAANPPRNVIVVPYWHPSYGYHRTCWGRWPKAGERQCPCDLAPVDVPPAKRMPQADERDPDSAGMRQASPLTPVTAVGPMHWPVTPPIKAEQRKRSLSWSIRALFRTTKPVPPKN